MTQERSVGMGPELERALAAQASSVRLRSALRAGTEPNPEYIAPLIERCAVEPDFSVREMLTCSRATVLGGAAARAHALATERIMADHAEGFDAAIAEARQTMAHLEAPHLGG